MNISKFVALFLFVTMLGCQHVEHLQEAPQPPMSAQEVESAPDPAFISTDTCGTWKLKFFSPWPTSVGKGRHRLNRPLWTRVVEPFELSSEDSEQRYALRITIKPRDRNGILKKSRFFFETIVPLKKGWIANAQPKKPWTIYLRHAWGSEQTVEQVQASNLEDLWPYLDPNPADMWIHPRNQSTIVWNPAWQDQKGKIHYVKPQTWNDYLIPFATVAVDHAATITRLIKLGCVKPEFAFGHTVVSEQFANQGLSCSKRPVHLVLPPGEISLRPVAGAPNKVELRVGAGASLHTVKLTLREGLQVFTSADDPRVLKIYDEEAGTYTTLRDDLETLWPLLARQGSGLYLFFPQEEVWPERLNMGPFWLWNLKWQSKSPQTPWSHASDLMYKEGIVPIPHRTDGLWLGRGELYADLLINPRATEQHWHDNKCYGKLYLRRPAPIP